MSWAALLYLARRPKSSPRVNTPAIENEIELPLAERERAANL
jgi:hypothetical protein